MPSERRAGLPQFWTTHIAKALVGDQPCLLSPWLNGHYTLEKRERDDAGTLAKWKADHTEQLNALAAKCEADGWSVRKEQFFRVKGQTGILSGKVDLVTQAKDRRPVIWDAKSGTPRDSDPMQVLIEMVMLPLAWHAPGMQFDGCVVYPNQMVRLHHAASVDIKPKVFKLLRDLGVPHRPSAAPSRDACRFCDVSETDCPDRFREQPDAETTEF